MVPPSSILMSHIQSFSAYFNTRNDNHDDVHMIISYMKLILMFIETHWYSHHSWWWPYDHLIYETHLHVLWDSLILTPLMVMTIWSSDIWNSSSCSLRLTDTHDTHGDGHMIISYMKLIFIFFETHWYSRHSWWRPYDHLRYETHPHVLWDSLILMTLMGTAISSSDIWNSSSCSLRYVNL